MAIVASAGQYMADILEASYLLFGEEHQLGQNQKLQASSLHQACRGMDCLQLGSVKSTVDSRLRGMASSSNSSSYHAW